MDNIEFEFTKLVKEYKKTIYFRHRDKVYQQLFCGLVFYY